MSPRPLTILSHLGSTLDGGFGARRWERWRPNVALCAQPDLLVHRLELLVPDGHDRLASQLVADIARISPKTRVGLHPLPPHDPWDLAPVYGHLYDQARALALDPEEEDLLVHITTGSHVVQICLFLLAESRHLPGRLLQTMPAKDRLADPHGGHTIIDLDLSRYDALARRFAEEQALHEATLKGGISTRNQAFNHTISQLEQVALKSRHPVLISGPTGAGKSFLARRVHALRHARRLTGANFVELNCATLRGDQAMATLFGHTRGAFTGAARERPGLLRAADGGLLFLDEIGELGLDEQAMLLRALEEKRFLPLGADAEASSDFQLIAGSNRDLGASVAEGRFRADLLARIDTWHFRLPALRERPEDIAPNLDFELERFAREEGRRVMFNREAKERFLGFAVGPEGAWTRNFRDLLGAVTRMATLAPGGRIGLAEVEEEIDRLRAVWARPEPGAEGEARDEALLRELLGEAAAEIDLFDAVQLAHVVRICRRCASQSEAGRQLFARSRERRTSTNDADRIRKYLARFGLDFEGLGARSAPAPTRR